MGVHNNVPALEKGPREHLCRDGPLDDSLSSSSLKTPTTPLSPRLSKQTSTRRNYSITATLTVAGPAYSTDSAVTPTSPALSSASVMAPGESDRALHAQPDPATQEFRGDIKVSAALPSKSTLEKIADLSVFDVDGKSLAFKSLYWPDGNASEKVLIIFIRHFFCGVCIGASIRGRLDPGY